MKAILILDEMPKGCDYCHYCRWSNTLDGDYCEANVGILRRIGDGGYYGEGVKPSWCPLKSMPEKNNGHTQILGENGTYSRGWCDGWNNCLKEIEE